MKNKRLIFILFAVYSVLIGCAGTYFPIKPSKVSYSNTFSSGGVDFSYKYDSLEENGSRKYAKKEKTTGIKIVGIKVTNNSGKDLVFNKDIILYSGNKLAIIIPPNDLFKAFKQHSASYLLYLALTPVSFYKIENGVITSKIPFGLFLGPAIAFGNIGTAASANKQFKKELLENTLNGTTIKNGETKYGIVGIGGNQYDPLSIQLNPTN